PPAKLHVLVHPRVGGIRDDAVDRLVRNTGQEVEAVGHLDAPRRGGVREVWNREGHRRKLIRGGWRVVGPEGGTRRSVRVRGERTPAHEWRWAGAQGDGSAVWRPRPCRGTLRYPRLKSMAMVAPTAQPSVRSVAVGSRPRRRRPRPGDVHEFRAGAGPLRSA